MKLVGKIILVFSPYQLKFLADVQSHIFVLLIYRSCWQSDNNVYSLLGYIKIYVEGN